MALTKQIIAPQGLTINNAYIRIDEQRGTKDICNIRVRNYVSKEAFDNRSEYVSEKVYSFTPSVTDNAPNFIKQGYEYLKTLPEFTDAIDA